MADTGLVDVREQIVAFPYRPRTVAAYRDEMFSCLRLISKEAFRRGLRRLEVDLARGPIPRISRTPSFGERRHLLRATRD